MVATAPLEQAIATALESMRRAAAKAAAKGRDDFYETWTADVMDRQPIIFVAAALPGGVMAWVIDPSDAEGVLEAHVSYRFDLPDADGAQRHDLPPSLAKHEMWTRLYASVVEDVSWLVRERSGQHIRDYKGWWPETD
jgi:hypothetical protein